METKLLRFGVLVLYTVFCGSYAKPTVDLCANCPLVNGVAFMSHADCNKYIHCYEDGMGKVVGVVQQCGFGTEWSQEVLTCVAATNATCAPEKDLCYNLPDGVARKGEGNCRGYWVCENKNSVPECCPAGQYYNEAHGCLDTDDDHVCEDSCFNDRWTPKPENTTAPVVTTKMPCDHKRPVIGTPSQYEEDVVGWGWLKRLCPAGLHYVQDDCGCTETVQVTQLAECKPELYLPFTNDHYDYSGKNNYVMNQNVDIANGTAVFNSHNSELIVPFFTNNDASTIDVQVNYSSDHKSLVKEQAIVSNSDCGIDPSIVITEDSDFVKLTVGTSLGNTNFETHMVFNQTALPDKQVSLTFESKWPFVNGVMTGKLGSEEQIIHNVPGHLRSVHCALHIGNADKDRGHWFKGTIDEVIISLCA